MLKIVTLNVNGIRNNQKRQILSNHFSREKYDIICLQETHSASTDESLWRKEWGGDIFSSHGERDSRGVAILASYRSGIKLVNPDSDKDGRIVTGDVSWKGINLSILCIYAPCIYV